jgi:cardiolipin synthase C
MAEGRVAMIGRLVRLAAAGMVMTCAACASVPPGATFPRQESRAAAPRAGIVTQASPEAPPHDNQSAFRMLTTGIDGLAVRLELIDAAERALDLQYYIFRGDESGGLVAQAILRAADRGVRVRILVDDGESIAGDERLFALAAHPLIQIRIFNPFDYRGHIRVVRDLDFAFHKKRLDYRMHNKLLVADNGLALIGGRNIGDQYFQIDPESQFGDDDVAVAGPMVQRLSGVFDEFWNTPLAIPVNAIDKKHTSEKALAAYRKSLGQRQELTSFQSDLSKRLSVGEPLAEIIADRTALTWATAELVYDSPDKRAVVDDAAPGRLISAPMYDRMGRVNSELLMITPYFVPSPQEDDLLERLRARDVRISVLTNSLEAAPNLAAHSGYARCRPMLLKEGIELHEIRARVGNTKGTGQHRAISQYGNYALHAKLYVFDRQAVFIGSMNFDQRSQSLNTEIGLIIDSPAIATTAAARFASLTQLKDAYSVLLVNSGVRRREHLVWKTEVNGMVTAQSTEPGRSRWQRFKVRLLSWLPLDREL